MKVKVGGFTATVSELGTNRYSVRFTGAEAELVDGYWPSDEEISDAVGLSLVFLDGGDHPTDAEGIYRLNI